MNTVGTRQIVEQLKTNHYDKVSMSKIFLVRDGNTLIQLSCIPAQCKHAVKGGYQLFCSDWSLIKMSPSFHHELAVHFMSAVPQR